MWNPNPLGNASSEFDNVIVDDVDSGSDQESDWDDAEDLDEEMAVDHVGGEERNDSEDEEEEPEMDEWMLPFSMDENAQLHGLNTTTATSRSSSRTPSPPPYSPLNSPRNDPLASPNADQGQGSNVVRFYSDSEEGTAGRDNDDWNPRASYVSIRGQGRGAIRGRARPPTVQRPAGRGRRVLANAVGPEYVRREGFVLEVCLDDEDVPPELREMVRRLEQVRSSERPTRREGARRKEGGESTVVSELFGGDEGATEFTWSSMATFNGSRCHFDPGFEVGPTRNCSDAYSAFRQFWDDEILEHIVRETNRYALGLKEKSERFARDWYDTNVHEILILFSFWMMLGVIRLPSIKSCFSTDFLLKTEIFRMMMSQSRYWLLNRALHFVDNSTKTANSSKLFCLGPIPDHLNAKFKELYKPSQDITIDESLTLWKGNLGFRQYIKTKAARFGIKTFELCESATGYLWSFIIYQGKEISNKSAVPMSTEVVVRLIRPLLNKGYRLFMDNWFNSPILARFLKRNNTDCVGTLRKNCKDVPPIIQLAQVPESTFLARHSGDVALMVYHDKRPVYTISTHHDTGVTHIEGKPGRPAHYKPTVIVDYNANMGGVDRKDQMLEPYLIERKRCSKWYKTTFKRLMNISIFNSHIIYEKSNKRLTQTKQLTFRLDLVKQILQHHLSRVPQPRIPMRAPARQSVLPPARLVGKHFIKRAEVDSESTAGASRTKRLTCAWCAFNKRRSRTVWMCDNDNCGVPLCVEGCFKAYHTHP